MNEVSDISLARAARAKKIATAVAERVDKITKLKISYLAWRKDSLFVTYIVPKELSALHARIQENPAFGLSVFAAVRKICFFSGGEIEVVNPDRITAAIAYDPPPKSHLVFRVVFHTRELSPSSASKTELDPHDAYHVLVMQTK